MIDKNHIAIEECIGDNGTRFITGYKLSVVTEVFHCSEDFNYEKDCAIKNNHNRILDEIYGDILRELERAKRELLQYSPEFVKGLEYKIKQIRDLYK